MLDLLQWPAMLASVLAAWLVASNNAHKRNIGFWVFLASNVLWVAWGWPQHAYALVVLQVVLALMNIRGLKKTESLQEKSDTTTAQRPMHNRG
ncbi:hypothetical protein [Ramlibacter albus]|uniref:Amino acid transporter n=1 Tax=Ramlibacter albus TaxID=2079448 RepID=A0A923MB78_9BURK|nr:hypothetical protein [Ramlibacter albus]MBC5766139.1 hypothetical protein [Ramlibacter albus]